MDYCMCEHIFQCEWYCKNKGEKPKAIVKLTPVKISHDQNYLKPIVKYKLKLLYGRFNLNDIKEEYINSQINKRCVHKSNTDVNFIDWFHCVNVKTA